MCKYEIYTRIYIYIYKNTFTERDVQVFMSIILKNMFIKRIFL